MAHPHVALPHVALPYVVRAVEKSWSTLWTARIGPLPLARMHLDAQATGKIFQELLAYALHDEDARWRHPDAPRHARDPDFVFENPAYNFELKTCGQAGGRAVFGNRCSSAGIASDTGKSRSTWLLTINYSLVEGPRLNIVRFGFVDSTDWIGQRAATGNSSRLNPEAYASKLRILKGDYQLRADPRILKGRTPRYATVGEAAGAGCAEALTFLEAEYY